MNMRGLWVILVIAGCKSSAVDRAEKSASAKGFWPEAPAVTSKTGTRALRYKPENIAAYTLTAQGGTAPGADVSIDFTMTLALAFAPGATPNERDARIAKLALDVNGQGQRMKMKLDHDSMMVEQGGDPPVTFKRGDGNAALDVAAMTDKPFTTLVFGEDNTVKVRSIPDHPFTSLGGSGDMLDDALVLFPDLPKDAVAPGYKWKVGRDTKIGGTGVRAHMEYEFEYLGDGACPSGAKACSQLSLTASSKDVEVSEQGITAHVTYGMAGKVFLDTDKGTLDESRVHMDIDLKAQGQKLSLGGTYIVKPGA